MKKKSKNKNDSVLEYFDDELIPRGQKEEVLMEQAEHYLDAQREGNIYDNAR
jgi:hypothetical protein